MTVGPVSRHSDLPHPAHDRLAAWAVRLGAGVAIVVPVVYVIFGITYAVGGESAISDTFVGYLAGFALLGGLATSLVAFVLAVAAKVQHEVRPLLWLPLTVFPVLFAFVVLAEAFWME